MPIEACTGVQILTRLEAVVPVRVVQHAGLCLVLRQKVIPRGLHLPCETSSYINNYFQKSLGPYIRACEVTTICPFPGHDHQLSQENNGLYWA